LPAKRRKGEGSDDDRAVARYFISEGGWKVSLLKIKPIILDSSTWINLINQNTLDTTLNNYINSGYVPFLTLHNLRELMNTNNDALKKERLNRLSTVKYYVNISGKEIPIGGNILSEIEAKYVIENKKKNINYIELQEFIRSKINIISGYKLMGEWIHIIDQLSDYLKNNDSGLYFSSVPPELHNNGYNVKKLTLKDLNLTDLNDAEFLKHKNLIIKNLKEKGEKKGANLIDGAEMMLTKWYQDLKKVDAVTNLEILAKIAKLPVELISYDMKVSEYMSLMDKYSKLDILSSHIGCKCEILLGYNVNLIPTFVFDEYFVKEYRKQILNDKRRRAESSIFEDRYLSYFSIYFDTIVDKRTGEVLNRIKKLLPFDIKYHINHIILE
jgi:hypothetical protein